MTHALVVYNSDAEQSFAKINKISKNSRNVLDKRNVLYPNQYVLSISVVASFWGIFTKYLALTNKLRNNHHHSTNHFTDGRTRSTLAVKEITGERPQLPEGKAPNEDPDN